ncbi:MULTISPECIES: glycosyltransferase family 4 protein [Weissella]|uniref:glycosyltransferase family 4 protein n=1 Tax=Weissella TaxID=46255 RepID=UPI00223A9FA4|nr:glycosyltransferase family 4 protein [Weissella cibaria]MCS8561650.1 glycosyltransferase [Weissella cibaria]MCS8564875.1 glycosyltransferase [Weissella cibaria]MCS8575374.1 glycosyltransferase [Weissella cibaria]
MKILVVVGFHDDTPSGGRKILYEYSNLLAADGHDVEMKFVANTQFPGRKRNLLVNVKNVIRYIRDVKKQYDVSWFKLNKKIKISTIFRSSQIDYSGFDRVILFSFAIALGVDLTNNNPEKFFYFVQADEKVNYDTRVVRKAWQLPIRKIAVSKWLANQVSTYDSNVKVVQNYVDVNEFYITRPIASRKAIALLNHASPAKGTAFGIDVLQKVLVKFPNTEIIMFGNPTKPDNLPFDVTYYQSANHNELREKVYNKAAVFLFTSKLEGWGLVASEAMASGATLVTTKNGGVEDFALQNQTALLGEFGEVDQMVENITTLLSNEQYRVRLAQAGALEMENFTIEKSFSKFKRALNIDDKATE